ncbi:Kinesin motor domain [Musa troglodytarum]|uniref:Kinesin motor domain n=1 Tax=Musa troglodytarum TaxID=320322 RepID=A0A9E7JVB3_9LILI|nr:Kinesin motor domain [Musa troglodytarum]
MDSPSSPCPPTTVRRNPPRRAKQTTYAEALPPASLSQDTSCFADADNLKVFLRIRPIEVAPARPGRMPPKAGTRALAKGAPPKVERRRTGACLSVNGHSSVTLSAPSLLYRGRAKNEVYDGFSFVFPPDSTQQEVYNMAVNPVLMDFMGGKSGLLVALGPTGSGKTYTMFGCARNPGVVPLILKQLFDGPSQGDLHERRSYYLSMFEIHSERGKGERILDLSHDGVELSFQHSTVIGLKEVMVSNIAEAENAVALGMLKRSTAATSANDQSRHLPPNAAHHCQSGTSPFHFLFLPSISFFTSSSSLLLLRSQCIINIRKTETSLSEHSVSLHGAVLTIADLAGAERERKTGNQGARLLESNFINNTSMALLEHQRNPRKPIEKHFKNSLILMVKPGEDDYADTSFLLRQASPYMKIKFTNLEDMSSLPNRKRSTSSPVKVDHHKRRKIDVSKTSSDDEGIHGSDGNDGIKASKKDASSKKLQEIGIQQSTSISSKINEPATMETPMKGALYIELQKMTRQEEIMRNFSKALWNVLKQYKEKLMESEKNVLSLREILQKDEIQLLVLKKELEELKSRCSCHKAPRVGESSSAQGEPLLDCCGTRLATPYQVYSSNVDSAFHDRGSLKMIDQVPENSPGVTLIPEDYKGPTDFGAERTLTKLNKSDIDYGSANSLNSLCMVDGINVSSSSVEKITHLKENEGLIDKIPENMPGRTIIQEDFNGLADFGSQGTSAKLDKSGICNGRSSSLDSLCIVDDINVSSSSVQKVTNLKENGTSAESDRSRVQHVKSNDKYHVRKVLKEKNGPVSKSSNAEKPKRKLLPASAMLLKELTGPDMEAANGDARGKIPAGGHGVSQRSTSLFSLLRKQS